MEKYINGGIIKELTLYLKKNFSYDEITNKLSKKINLDLYNISYEDNFIFLELKDYIFDINISSFLTEVDSNFNIGFRNININDSEFIKNDFLFLNRYKINHINSLYDEDYFVDILYYGFYFDGPYYDNSISFENMLFYLHNMHHKFLNNKLSGCICFGIN